MIFLSTGFGGFQSSKTVFLIYIEFKTLKNVLKEVGTREEYKKSLTTEMDKILERETWGFQLRLEGNIHSVSNRPN